MVFIAFIITMLIVYGLAKIFKIKRPIIFTISMCILFIGVYWMNR